jgi:hypothetical protein
MVISFMLIFEKLAIIGKACLKKINLYRSSKAVDKEIRKQKKQKVDLKKQFEAKGWRIAK